MQWPVYELIAEPALRKAKNNKYKTLRVRERTVLRHGSGVKVLKDAVVERRCRVHEGKVVLV